MPRRPDPVIRALKRQLLDVLLHHIDRRYTRFDVPQSHIADTLGISQPRLNALLQHVMSAEVRYLGAPGRRLPFGHTTFCVAVRRG